MNDAANHTGPVPDDRDVQHIVKPCLMAHDMTCGGNGPKYQGLEGPELVVDFVLVIGDPSWISLSGPAHVGPCRQSTSRQK